jgi:hypothetical protein
MSAAAASGWRFGRNYKISEVKRKIFNAKARRRKGAKIFMNQIEKNSIKLAAAPNKNYISLCALAPLRLCVKLIFFYQNDES